jgi:hypothetical protein
MFCLYFGVFTKSDRLAVKISKSVESPILREHNLEKQIKSYIFIFKKNCSPSDKHSIGYKCFFSGRHF